MHQKIETNYFRTRTSALLAERLLQRSLAHADVEVTRKVNSGEYIISKTGPATMENEVSRQWSEDGRLEIFVESAE